MRRPRILTTASLLLALAPAGAHAAVHPRVVNGRAFSAPDYMGFVVAADAKITAVASCTGAAIRPNVLLTAAHCFFDGRHRKVLDRDAIVFGQDDPVRALLAHQDVSPDPVVDGAIPTSFRELPDGSSINDIALVQLRDPAPATVSLAPSGHRRLTRKGTSAAVLGWGATNANRNGDPAPLQRADLTVQSARYCGQEWRYFNSSRMLCAWSASQSLCYGDSGAPLLVRGPGGGVVVAGVTDDGEQHCTPGVAALFANVAYGPLATWVRHNAARLQKHADAARPQAPTVPVTPAAPATPATPATPPADGSATPPPLP